MANRIQITKARLEYDLTTNSVKFMQQTTLSFVRRWQAINTYCSTPTW